jgi:hypothetical protein
MRAEADGERRQCRERESWGSRQPTVRVSDVLAKRVDEAEAARLPALECHVVDAAELVARAASRICRRHAVADEIGGVGVDVETQLVGEIVLEPAAADESDEKRSQA